MSSAGPQTLVDELQIRAQQDPGGLAILRKRHGIWETTTWSELAGMVDRLAGALRERGLAPGGTVVIIADATPEWLALDLAAQAIGAVSIALYPQQSGADIRSVVGDTPVDVLAGGDDEQLGRARDAVSSVRLALLLDARSLRRASETGVELVTDLRVTEHSPRPEGDASAPTVGLVSAGTSGSPRLVHLSPRETLAFARRGADWLGVTRSDRNLCHIPCALPTVRLLDLYAPICAGSTIAFPESPQTIVENMVELQPTVLTTTPRALEQLMHESEHHISECGRVKAAANRWARQWREQGLEPGSAVGRPGLGHFLVDRPIVKQLGLGAARRVVSAGAPLAPRLLAHYWSLRVPVVETYGQPETFGLAFAQRGSQDAGTVGLPLPGIQPRIESGTLRLRRLEADGEEWLQTGDLAALDGEGRLVLAGASGDVVVGGDGTQLILPLIEAHLRVSPFVSEAVVVADPAGGVHALIQFEFIAVSGWLSEQGHAVSAYYELSRDPAVIGLIETAVAEVNESLTESERISSFRLLERPLSLERGEISPNRRVRRATVQRSFAAHLAEMSSAR